ncbi:hypothetical protein Mapa_006453 [Marchantia paleacea]|nr:hypothetical protein Mapa_006453 [Marchantia paleacea]
MIFVPAIFKIFDVSKIITSTLKLCLQLSAGSVFMFGRFLSSMPWGMFADRFGRRPVFALGLLSVIVFQLIFGSTKSFWVAFAARFMLGAFNGMLGPLKVNTRQP